MRAPAPFVGRVDVLDATLARLSAGSDRRGVAIVGPPGQGKTRLARELVARIGEGTRVWSVVATSAAATIPLGALLPVLPEATDRPDTLTDLVARAIRSLSAGDQGPALLVVDDAHLLDPASATVVHQLAVAGAAIPLLTLRSGEPAPDAVTALWKEGTVERVDLGPLTREETGDVAAGLIGGTLARAAVEDLWRISAGNPMVATELVRGALEAEDLHREHGVWRFRSPLRPSARLAELVGERLCALTHEAREVVELLALGEPLPLPLLRPLASDPVISDLERGGLVAIGRVEAADEVRLAHPLYAEVVRQQMGVVRAQAVSRILADAAEGPHGGGIGALRAAVWRLDGGGDRDPELLLKAARMAFFGHDDELAERLAAAAVEAGAGIEALVVQAQAMSFSGRHADAVQLLSHPGPVATTDRQRLMVARCLSFARFWGLGQGEAGLADLAGAEAEVADDACRRELAAERAVMQLLAGDVPGGLAVAEPIVNADDGRAMVTAAIAMGIGLSLVGDSERAAALAERAFQVHVGLGDQEALASPGMHVVARALALQEAGRIRESLEVCTVGHAAAVDSSSSSGQAWFLLLAARAALLQGRPVTARQQFGESAGLFADLGEYGPRRWALAGCALTAALVGDVAGSSEAIAALDASPPVAMRVMQAELDRARAWLLAARRDTDAAIAQLQQAIASADEMGAPALALAAVHDLGRLGAAPAAAELLRPLAGRVAGPVAEARALHVAALAADDPTELGTVADRWAEIGADLFAAEAAAAASALWRRRGDVRRADRAANWSRELAARCEGAATPALTLASEAALLTPREREVSLLAAASLTAKQIATRLGLSPRTVENHLQRAYAKLAVSSREELVDALHLRSAPR